MKLILELQAVGLIDTAISIEQIAELILLAKLLYRNSY